MAWPAQGHLCLVRIWSPGGTPFLKVLENNKSKILWEFEQLLPDQPHTAVVVKEQKRAFIINEFNLSRNVASCFAFSCRQSKSDLSCVEQASLGCIILSDSGPSARRTDYCTFSIFARLSTICRWNEPTLKPPTSESCSPPYFCVHFESSHQKGTLCIPYVCMKTCLQHFFKKQAFK